MPFNKETKPNRFFLGIGHSALHTLEDNFWMKRNKGNEEK